MKKVLLSLAFLPLLANSVNSANVETVIRTEATGENASVRTEITNIINGEVTHIESTSPGEIKVEVKNGEVKIESSDEVSPTVTIGREREIEETQGRVFQQVENIKNRVFYFIRNLFSGILKIFGS